MIIVRKLMITGVLMIVLGSIGFLGARYEVFTEQYMSQIFIEHQGWAPIVFVLLYILATISFIPATPLSLVGGAIFGSVYGSFYILIGATIGAIGAFILARFLLRDWISQFITIYISHLSQYDQYLAQNGFGTVIFLRLIPLFPFNGLNFALGLTRVSLISYSVGTLVGIIPMVVVTSFLGASLVSREMKDIAIVVVLYVSFASVGIIYNRYHRL